MTDQMARHITIQRLNEQVEHDNKTMCGIRVFHPLEWVIIISIVAIVASIAIPPLMS